MDRQFVSPAPHVREEGSVAGMQFCVMGALLPALIWSVYCFGWRVLVVTLTAMASAVAAEVLICRFLRKKDYRFDGSSALSGMLFAMLLPPAVSLGLAVLGGLLAVGVKEAFGGIGKNPINPALTAALILYLPFAKMLTGYTRPFAVPSPLHFRYTLEEIAANAGDPTPLTQLKAGQLPSQMWYGLLSGDVPGGIGEGSALLLLAGGLFLFTCRVTTWHAPAGFLVGIALMGLPLAPEGADPWTAMGLALASGGAALGAFFFVTDPVTGPVTRWGKLCYGLLAGVLAALFRFVFGNAYGMALGILLANLAAHPLDVLFRPRPYGVGHVEHLRRFVPTRATPPAPAAAEAAEEPVEAAPEDLE